MAANRSQQSENSISEYYTAIYIHAQITTAILYTFPTITSIVIIISLLLHANYGVFTPATEQLPSFNLTTTKLQNFTYSTTTTPTACPILSILLPTLLQLSHDVFSLDARLTKRDETNLTLY